MSWELLALAVIIVAAGAALQGSVGFGLGPVAAPLLMLLDRRLVPVPLLMCALVLVLLIAFRDRRSVDVLGIPWALGGRAMGVVLGVAAVVHLPEREMTVTFGALVIAAVVMSALGLRARRTRWTLIGAGTLSGFIGTTTSIGGPPMAMVYQEDKGALVRGTLSVFFAVGVILSLSGLAVVGRVGSWELTHALALIPGVIVGFIVSHRTASLLDRGYTRAAILGVSALSGIVVILRELL
jgi:uncharacterized membrane protein YfcA